MFRKPKRATNKTALRHRKEGNEVTDNTSQASSSKKQEGDSDSDSDEPDTSALLAEARGHKKQKLTGQNENESSYSSNQPSGLMHEFKEKNKSCNTSEKDLATSTADHHGKEAMSDHSVGFGADGIFRDKSRNKFHAGPIRAAQNVRVTARFDYQPDICKDYKQTGFCGFGDTCIYLHDRGDTLSGWQLEQQWQQQEEAKKKAQEAELDAYLKVQEQRGGAMPIEKAGVASSELDGLPFACHICRKHFVNPVVTNCFHYFCQSCIIKHVQEHGEACPICGKDTFGVFNEPTKLIAKKRKVLGSSKPKSEESWRDFYNQFHTMQGEDFNA